jgi:hypothetical protein
MFLFASAGSPRFFFPAPFFLVLFIVRIYDVIGDSNKIRLQLALDTQEYIRELRSFGTPILDNPDDIL